MKCEARKCRGQVSVVSMMSGQMKDRRLGEQTAGTCPIFLARQQMEAISDLGSGSPHHRHVRRPAKLLADLGLAQGQSIQNQIDGGEPSRLG